MSFQKVVNVNQAPGVLGDFASTNPFSSITTAQGGLVAPAGGLTVGNFFWVGPLGQTSQAFVSGWQIAFLGRNEQALITQFLGETSLVVPQGFMVVGFNGWDFWAYFANGATAGATVYADETTGEPQMQATNTGTGEVGFTGTASFATNVMTVVTNTSGIILPGDVVTSATVTSGTTVLAQLTGLPGAVGSTYSLSTAPGTIATQAATTASNVLNLTALTTGGFSVGDVISGTGVTAGTQIAQQLTGSTGGVGTYLLNIPGGVAFNTASETITGPANTSSGWTVGPVTLVGAGIAKISHAAV